MGIVLLYECILVGLLVSNVQGTVTYGSPYNYGNTDEAKPHFPEALVTYGPPQRAYTPQTASQRARVYPSPQQKSYYAVQPRTYTQQRHYASVQPITHAQPQTRTYTYGQPRPVYTPAQPRSFPSAHIQPYTPIHPQVYSQFRRHPAYSLAQPRTYTHPATAYGQRSSTGYLMPARQSTFRPVVRQPMRAPVRQPINTGLRQTIQPISAVQSQPMSTTLRQPIRPVATNNAFVRQEMRNPQTLYARALAPKLPTLYQTAIRPVAQLPQSFAARPVVPVPLATYGRNHIPKTPGGSIVSGKPILPEINHPLQQYRSNKRNNIALSIKKYPQTSEKTQAERNFINGISLPQKVTGKAPKGPIKPQINPSPVRSKSLNEPIKPQVSANSHTAHKLSTYLKSVKNLQEALQGKTMKQGLIYYDDDVSNKSHHRPTNFAPPTRKLGSMGSPGGSRVTFNEEESARQQEIVPETKAINQAGSERVNIAQTNKNVTNNDGELTKNLYQNNKTTKSETPHADTVDATKPQAKSIVGSAKSPNFAAAQVDLGLLKKKVLHSNNSQFLKRVLHVLKKYTKLMKTSMAEKNQTGNVLNASVAEEQNIKKLGDLKGISKNNETNLERGAMDLSNALNSTKTAVKIFDILNNPSKENLKSSTIKELNRNSTKSESESETKVFDLMSSNSKPEQNSKDENASKKGVIETGKTLRKSVFSLDKLKNGLERGNAID